MSGDYTTLRISKTTQSKLIRARGWLSYHKHKKMTFDDAISEVCDFFDKNKELAK